jgi:hypothetical protein
VQHSSTTTTVHYTLHYSLPYLSSHHSSFPPILISFYPHFLLPSPTTPFAHHSLYPPLPLPTTPFTHHSLYPPLPLLSSHILNYLCLFSSPPLCLIIHIIPYLTVNTDRSKISNALNLVAEVTPNKGGRILRLSSVFTIKNNTSHNIQILPQVSPRAVRSGGKYSQGGQQSGRELSDSSTDRERDRLSPHTVPNSPAHTPNNSSHPAPPHSPSLFKTTHSSGGEGEVDFEGGDVIPLELKGGEKFRVPMALLHRSISESKGKK